MKKVFLLTTILLCTTSLYAAMQEEKIEKEDNRNPIGCKDTGYEFELRTLRLVGAKDHAAQSMFFVFNKSNQVINLFQMLNEESSRSLYLNHAINPQSWAALAISEMPIKFLCTVSRKANNYGEVTDCSQNLNVCQFVNVKFGLNNGGNFWLVNSNSRNGAVRDVVRYGIIPDYRVSEKRKSVNASNKKRKSP